MLLCFCFSSTGQACDIFHAATDLTTFDGCSMTSLGTACGCVLQPSILLLRSGSLFCFCFRSNYSSLRIRKTLCPPIPTLPHLQLTTPTMKYDEILKWRQDVYEATIGQYAQPAVAATSSRRLNSTWAVSQLSAHMEQGASLSVSHSSIQPNSPFVFC